MALLEAGDRLGQACVEAAVRGRLSDRGVLHGEPGAQRLHGVAAGPLAHATMAGHALPAATGRDRGVGRQGLDQRLVAGGLRRQGLQPVGNAIGALRGPEIGIGIIAGGTDAPFLGELIGG